MYNNYDYPYGADNPNAPWNQKDLDPIAVKVCVSTTLSKSTSIEVSEYIENTWEDSERDEDGHLVKTGGHTYDFSCTDFQKEYKMTGCKSPIELLHILNKLASEKAENLLDEFKNANTTAEKTKLQVELSNLNFIITESAGWTEDELEIIQED